MRRKLLLSVGLFAAGGCHRNPEAIQNTTPPPITGQAAPLTEQAQPSTGQESFALAAKKADQTLPAHSGNPTLMSGHPELTSTKTKLETEQAFGGWKKGVLIESDIEPPLSSLQSSADSLTYELEHNASLFAQPDEALQSVDSTISGALDQCLLQKLQTFRIQGNLGSLEISGEHDLGECFYPPFHLLDKNKAKPASTALSYKVKLFSAVHCEGVDFSNLTGKSWNELLSALDSEKSKACLASKRRSHFLQSRVHLHSIKKGSAIHAVVDNTRQNLDAAQPEITFENEQLKTQYFGKMDGTPCVSVTDQGLVVLQDGCVSVQKHSNLKNLADGKPISFHNSQFGFNESYSRFESNKITLVNNLGKMKYLTGKFLGLHNTWKGEIEFTGEQSPPRYYLAADSKNHSNTFAPNGLPPPLFFHLSAIKKEAKAWATEGY